MSLTLIHGDNHFKSREFFQGLLDKYKRQGVKDRVYFDPKNFELDTLTQALESKSLFGGDRLIVIEGLFALRSKRTKKQALDLLKTADPHKDHLILWEKKSLTKSTVKKLPNFTANEFKTSALIFKFLESIGSPNIKHTVDLYRRTCLQDSPEFVLYMLARHVRQLLLSGSEYFKGAPWQQKKLVSQKKRLGENTIHDLHERLFHLDISLKTGRTVSSLENELLHILIT